ncbi:precorrin-6y C5,15-methyltransferase (decarboxylating), CbiE subunit [Candidatus Magnetobacterium bavaricum]|uniref:Precorrin-6y C5,15-methyltransferase (Decarboxylating), CbiE subunit n=1 Tax=Candidatus Magnetobacterium bavaricum TaxID=29290 RepID=A0A0F3GQY1_9BACT|nr:precorrin-6y C5,15-methyltransferase (decarboxylating), CbiE subunit [Candidatus Magnetobacterium bavaricum]
MHRITVISSGPGSADFMTLLAHRKASASEVLIGMQLQLSAVDTSACTCVYEESSINEILKLIEKHEGQEVGVLVTGDAGIFSLTQKISALFGKDAIKEVIPGVSSIQTGFARLKESWANVRVFSFHGREICGLDEVLAADRAAVLCDKVNNASELLRRMDALGLFQDNRRVFVCENLTLEDERVTEIANIDELKGLRGWTRQIVLLIKPVV